MGLLDNNITFSYLEGKVPLEDLFEVIKQKLGDKYKVEFIKKGNVASQVLGTSSSVDIVSLWQRMLTIVLLSLLNTLL